MGSMGKRVTTERASLLRGDEDSNAELASLVVAASTTKVGHPVLAAATRRMRQRPRVMPTWEELP